MGYFDGATVTEIHAIPAVYAKGQPGLWRLDLAAEQLVRERYAAAREKAQRAALTSGPDFPWGDC